MDCTLAEAKDKLPALIRAMEEGETVIITRNGRPVAQLAPPPADRRQVRLGGMRDRVILLPGWDDSIDPDGFWKEICEWASDRHKCGFADRFVVIQ